MGKLKNILFMDVDNPNEKADGPIALRISAIVMMIYLAVISVMPVSYTHLDVYKRQNQVNVLADQSAQAAKESAALIESSVSAVEKGMVVAKETAAQLEEVADTSKIITREVTGDVYKRQVCIHSDGRKP